MHKLLKKIALGHVGDLTKSIDHSLGLFINLYLARLFRR